MEKVKEFEGGFSKYTGTKFGIATNSGTSHCMRHLSPWD